MSIHHLSELFFSWIVTFPPSMVLLIVVSVLFIGSILESIPMAGMFLPMETTTVFFGILAFKGIVDIKILLVVAFVGLVIGDVIGYYVGKKFGEEFLRKHAKKLKIDEDKYNTLKHSIDNHLIKVLFFARSNGFTRWLVPFLAGANGVDIKRFNIANLITAAFWSPAFLLGGFFLGKSFELFGKYIGLGIVIATILALLIYKSYKHFEKLSILKREDFRYFLVNILGLYLFFKMAEDVMDLELITKADIWMHSHINEIYTPLLTKSMIFMTSWGSFIPFTCILVFMGAFLIYKRYFKELYFLTFAIIGSSSLMYAVKNIVQRARPEHFLIEASGYSFPSGHATLVTAISFSIYLIFKDKTEWKKSLLFFAFIITFLISFSRVYLSVHYLSDVIAGIGLGLFWVSSLAIFYEVIKNKNDK
jgi:undecaprenyl-diphosphatase